MTSMVPATLCEALNGKEYHGYCIIGNRQFNVYAEPVAQPTEEEIRTNLLNLIKAHVFHIPMPSQPLLPKATIPSVDSLFESLHYSGILTKNLPDRREEQGLAPFRKRYSLMKLLGRKK